ncbi:MAG: DinB family protein [Thermoanaerobaculia bacterium]
MELARLFRYDDWANREEVEYLRNTSNATALRLFGHIIGSQWLWYGRLRGEASRAEVWPDLSLDDCVRSLDLLGSFWTEYLAGAPLEEKVTYENSKGETWTSRVEDVLTHVVMHGAYHRGQIATVLRGSGEEPAYTDYIHCTRNRFV